MVAIDTSDQVLCADSISEALRYVFSSYETRFSLSKGKADRSFRLPHIIIGIAKDLGVLPEPSRTVVVTGSKGKGTASRLIAWNLENSNLNIGLVLSPEEVQHRDRIRINNSPIGEEEFIRCLNLAKPRLAATLRNAPEDYYHSPTGIFLLVALIWFKAKAIDYCVIEGGRGALYDEISRIPANCGVVTSVFDEHVVALGPSIRDIAIDKLSLSKSCASVVISTQVKNVLSHLGIKIPKNAHVSLVNKNSHWQSVPRWYEDLLRAADDACVLVQREVRIPRKVFPYGTPSFMNFRFAGGQLVLDGAIHSNSIDPAFLVAHRIFNGAVLIGITDDKDFRGILSALRKIGFAHFYAAPLVSGVNHISSTWMRDCDDIVTVEEIDVMSGERGQLASTIERLVRRHGIVYAIGVQLFLRSIRQALGIGIVCPRVIV
jgi:dihydrofolate synthase/folylpolyglutamate synthase